MADLDRRVADAATTNGFSGVVRIDRDGEAMVLHAAGDADRAHGVPVRHDTRFGIASGTKGLTALTVMTLVEDETLSLSTPARSLLGADLPLIGPDVTVEHLLAHRSGIGDYLDEDELASVTDYVLAVPAGRLDSTEAYLAVLGGRPSKFTPGTRFSYCNSGYVVLALLAERAAGKSFADLVRDRVCGPAGMTRTGLVRSDELPGDAAVGYVADDGLRSNVFHLPVLGSGDGGIYSTVDDVHRLWRAMFRGAVVAPEWLDLMVRPRSEVPAQSMRYGLGFWLAPAGAGVRLEGSDAGVSFRSEHDPDRAVTWTVVANTTDGAWPVVRAVMAALG